MTNAEFLTLKEALGISTAALGAMMMPPVRERSVNYWCRPPRAGASSPVPPDEAVAILTETERRKALFVERILETHKNDTVIVLRRASAPAELAAIAEKFPELQGIAMTTYSAFIYAAFLALRRAHPKGAISIEFL